MAGLSPGTVNTKEATIPREPTSKQIESLLPRLVAFDIPLRSSTATGSLPETKRGFLLCRAVNLLAIFVVACLATIFIFEMSRGPSQIVNGQRDFSPRVLKKMHGALSRKSMSEGSVVPAEVEVLGWRKGVRRGVVVRGTGDPGDLSIRSGDRVPWGAQAECAYSAGYDSKVALSFESLVAPDSTAILVQHETVAA